MHESLNAANVALDADILKDVDSEIDDFCLFEIHAWVSLLNLLTKNVIYII